MALTMEIEGLTVRVDVPYEGGPYEVAVGGYGSTPEGMKDKKFKSLEAAQRAIKEYNLKLRKGFTNPTAFLVRPGLGRTDRIKRVTVTSVTESGLECWIKDEKGEREKVSMSRLYASADAVRAAILSEMDHREVIAKTWAAVPGWQPEFGGKEGA